MSIVDSVPAPPLPPVPLALPVVSATRLLELQKEMKAILSGETPQLPEHALFKPVVVPQRPKPNARKLGDSAVTSVDIPGSAAKRPAPELVALPNGTQGRVIPSVHSRIKRQDAEELDAKGQPIVPQVVWRRCHWRCAEAKPPVWKPLTVEYFGYISTRNTFQGACRECRRGHTKDEQAQESQPAVAVAAVSSAVAGPRIKPGGRVDKLEQKDADERPFVFKLPNGELATLLDTGRANCEDAKQLSNGQIWRKCLHDRCKAAGDAVAWKIRNSAHFQLIGAGKFKSTCRDCLRVWAKGAPAGELILKRDRHGRPTVPPVVEVAEALQAERATLALAPRSSPAVAAEVAVAETPGTPTAPPLPVSPLATSASVSPSQTPKTLVQLLSEEKNRLIAEITKKSEKAGQELAEISKLKDEIVHLRNTLKRTDDAYARANARVNESVRELLGSSNNHVATATFVA